MKILVFDWDLDRLDRAGWLRVTSTSTVQDVDETGRTTLMMFGVDYDTVVYSESGFSMPEDDEADYEEPFTDDTTDREAEFRDPDTKEPWDSDWDVVDWISYISSDSTDGTINIRNRDVGADEPYYPIHQTCIPAYRRAILGDTLDTDFGFHDIVYDVESAAGELLYGTDRDGTWAESLIGLLYKDPFVVYVPSATEGLSGWWMLLSRYRMNWSGDALPAATPESAVGDLVAYWSASPDFREGDVRGPFRLVGCTDCLLNASTGEVVEGVRFWIGTAGAAVVTEASGTSYLYVYYVVEKSTAYVSAIDEHDDPVRMADGTRVDRFEDGVDAALSEIVDDILAANEATPGTWLRKIALTDLDAALEDEASYVDEETWQDLPNASHLVPGSVTGRVRIWAVPDWGGGDDIQAKFTATTVWVDRHGIPVQYSVFWADPAPVVEDGILAMFVAGIFPSGVHVETTDVDYYNVLPYVAVWSAVAVTEDEAGADYGLYFTVRVPASVHALGGDADDRLVTSISPKELYIDPDPVGDVDGVGWCVYVGHTETYGKVTDTLGLYIATDSSQVFRAWDSA